MWGFGCLGVWVEDCDLNKVHWQKVATILVTGLKKSNFAGVAG